jgi:hypothetical protein
LEGCFERLLNKGRSRMTTEQYKFRFLTVVLTVWAVVVAAALYVYLARNGPLPDPVLLGIPTGTWLAVYPPLPSRLKEEPVDTGAD